jgi:hypothetical protein
MESGAAPHHLCVHQKNEPMNNVLLYYSTSYLAIKAIFALILLVAAIVRAASRNSN